MTLLTLLLMVIFFVFIVGLCIGSFLNVVIERAFSDESICFPGSKCPLCQKPLKWYHNIPILSYLILKGKCAFCNDTISIQYPIVELITGILFVAVFMKFGFNLNSIFMFIYTSLFIVISITDIREKVVFDFHTYALVVFGLFYNLFNLGHFYRGEQLITLPGFYFGINNSFIASIIGIILGIVLMEIFARLGYLFAGTRAFGEGDTYIAAGLGAIFGWKYLITILAYAFIIQVFLTIPVFLKKLYTNKDYKTLVAFFIFFLLVFAMKWLDEFNNLNNMTIFTTYTLILGAVGVYVCKRIISGLRDQKNMTYLPFGPAMVLGAFAIMFFVL